MARVFTVREKVSFFIKVYLLKIATVLIQLYLNYFGKCQPTYKKRYPVLPGLDVLVFLPQGHRANDQPLPLLIDIHGGGFAIGAPAFDNYDNDYLSKKGICVVSINYRKGPRYRFPTQVYDVVSLIEAVLEDKEIPFDRSKVAISGYSAGGNLAFASSQLRNLKSRIKGVVAYYPVTDFRLKTADRLKVTELPPPPREDALLHVMDAFRWAYISADPDLKDPLLSVTLAKRDDLPDKIFILGAQYDMLCPEAEQMAESLAKFEAEKRTQLVGGRVGWRQGRITFEKLMNMMHGFNHAGVLEKDKLLREEYFKTTIKMRENVAEWLFKEVYA